MNKQISKTYLLEASDELRDDCTDEGLDPRRLGEGGAGNPAWLKYNCVAADISPCV